MRIVQYTQRTRQELERQHQDYSSAGGKSFFTANNATVLIGIKFLFLASVVPRVPSTRAFVLVAAAVTSRQLSSLSAS